MTRLILAGGGHAHLFVLERLSDERPPDLEAVLVTPAPFHDYSGMLPGWLAGRYRSEECRIDLARLCARAGVQLLTDRVVDLNAESSCVVTGSGSRLSYDLLSLNVGSETDDREFEGLGHRLMPVKPFASFRESWTAFENEARLAKEARLVVAGGGAAGCELAMAARAALRRESPHATVTLIAGRDGLVPTHGRATRRRVAAALRRLDIPVIQERAAAATGPAVRLEGGRMVPADRVIAATGARAPAWLGRSGLALDPFGYPVVDSTHRSASHPRVFAAGDVCARPGSPLTRSGVHSVRTGPVLAHNLLAAARNEPLRRYRPRKRSLSLIASGDGRAIASWGELSVEGAWMGRLKDAIDRRFIRRFSRS